jgi:hypothetical protein
MFETILTAADFYIVTGESFNNSDKCTSHYCYTTVYHNLDCYFRTEKSIEHTYIQLLHYFHIYSFATVLLEINEARSSYT